MPDAFWQNFGFGPWLDPDFRWECFATRLITWAKTFAYAVGIPVAICFIVLGILGYRSIEDARKLTNEAAEKIRPVIEDALSKARQAQQQSADSLTRIAQVRESLKVTEVAVEKQRAAAEQEANQVSVQLAQISGIRMALLFSGVTQV